MSRFIGAELKSDSNDDSDDDDSNDDSDDDDSNK